MTDNGRVLQLLPVLMALTATFLELSIGMRPPTLTQRRRSPSCVWSTTRDAPRASSACGRATRRSNFECRPNKVSPNRAAHLNARSAKNVVVRGLRIVLERLEPYPENGRSMDAATTAPLSPSPTIRLMSHVNIVNPIRNPDRRVGGTFGVADRGTACGDVRDDGDLRPTRRSLDLTTASPMHTRISMRGCSRKIQASPQTRHWASSSRAWRRLPIWRPISRPTALRAWPGSNGL